MSERDVLEYEVKTSSPGLLRPSFEAEPQSDEQLNTSRRHVQTPQFLFSELVGLSFYRNVEQRPLWDRVEKLQSRPGSGSSSGSSGSGSQASPGDRFRPRCESAGTVLVSFSTNAVFRRVAPGHAPLCSDNAIETSPPSVTELCFFPKASSKSEGPLFQRPENIPRKPDEKNVSRPTRPAVSADRVSYIRSPCSMARFVPLLSSCSGYRRRCSQPE